MSWLGLCMAASGTGSLVFSGDVTHDGCSRMNYEVYKTILAANLQKRAFKLIMGSFFKQQDRGEQKRFEPTGAVWGINVILHSKSVVSRRTSDKNLKLHQTCLLCQRPFKSS